MKLLSNRLELRRMNLSNAESIARLANHPDITKTTMRMPYPCDISYIENWIKQDTLSGGKNTGFFVIYLKNTETAIGVVGLEVDAVNENAELGYWLGRDYWNQGYCTEAAKTIIEYGFNELHLNRIWTFFIEGNDASGRVLEKVGMKHEGTFKKHIKKNGTFRDLEYYGIIRNT